MAKYTNRTCTKCGLQRPQPYMKQVTKTVKGGHSIGINWNPNKKKKVSASGRQYYNRKASWVCSKRAACDDPTYFERMEAEEIEREARKAEEKALREAQRAEEKARQEKLKKERAAHELAVSAEQERISKEFRTILSQKSNELQKNIKTNFSGTDLEKLIPEKHNDDFVIKDYLDMLSSIKFNLGDEYSRYDLDKLLTEKIKDNFPNLKQNTDLGRFMSFFFVTGFAVQILVLFYFILSLWRQDTGASIVGYIFVFGLVILYLIKMPGKFERKKFKELRNKTLDYLEKNIALSALKSVGEIQISQRQKELGLTTLEAIQKSDGFGRSIYQLIEKNKDIPLSTKSESKRSVDEVGGNPASSDNSTLEVVLVTVGRSRSRLVSEVRKIAGLSISEATALVDRAPVAVANAADEDEANGLRKRLEAVGASVEIRTVSPSVGGVTPIDKSAHALRNIIEAENQFSLLSYFYMMEVASVDNDLSDEEIKEIEKLTELSQTDLDLIAALDDVDRAYEKLTFLVGKLFLNQKSTLKHLINNMLAVADADNDRQTVEADLIRSTAYKFGLSKVEVDQTFALEPEDVEEDLIPVSDLDELIELAANQN